VCVCVYSNTRHYYKHNGVLCISQCDYCKLLILIFITQLLFLLLTLKQTSITDTPKTFYLLYFSTWNQINNNKKQVKLFRCIWSCKSWANLQHANNDLILMNFALQNVLMWY